MINARINQIKEKVIIFGASLYGKIAYNVLKSKYEIVGFADNDKKKQGKQMLGVNIYSPEDIQRIDNISIIIASQYYAEIGKQLHNLGLDKIFVFFYFGNLNNEEEYNARYKLVKFNVVSIYQGIVIDKEEIKEIQKNFSLNYNNVNRIERNQSIESDRKKILFCAYYFPPLGLAGVQRSLKFVKYLREFGYEPIVVTVGNRAKYYSEDKSMLQEIPSDIEIIRIDDMLNSPIELTIEEQKQILNLYAGTGVSKGWIERYLNMVREEHVDYDTEVLLPEQCIYWANLVLKNIESMIDMSSVELVYTTTNPFSTNFIGYYVKQKYNIPWVNDYRDTWTTNRELVRDRYKYSEQVYCLLKELEELFVKIADHILVVADGMKEELQDEFKVPDTKVTTITNGFDEEDFDYLEKKAGKNEKFTLCYNGQIRDRDDRFDEKNNYTIVIKAINRLIEEKKIDRDKIQWIISGEIAESVKGVLESLDKFHIIIFNGYLEHKKSVKIAWESDMLVHFGFYNEVSKFGYGGKVFEYLRMKTPILFLSKTGGIFDELANEMGCGKNFEYLDEIGISEYILKLYNNWCLGSESIYSNEQKIYKYERKELTKTLANIFDKCIGEI